MSILNFKVAMVQERVVPGKYGMAALMLLPREEEINE